MIWSLPSNGLSEVGYLSAKRLGVGDAENRIQSF
jgi:hypothetical protein